MIVVVEISHFGPKADRNFIFPILIDGDAVGWTCTLYGTSTLALACPLVWSFGSTWLGLRQEAEKYFDFWSTICPFSTNCPPSYLMIVLQSASLIVYAPVISSSSLHFSSSLRCKCVGESFLAWLRTTFSTPTSQPAEL